MKVTAASCRHQSDLGRRGPICSLRTQKTKNPHRRLPPHLWGVQRREMLEKMATLTPLKPAPPSHHPPNEPDCRSVLVRQLLLHNQTRASLDLLLSQKFVYSGPVFYFVRKIISTPLLRIAATRSVASVTNMHNLSFIAPWHIRCHYLADCSHREQNPGFCFKVQCLRTEVYWLW